MSFYECNLHSLPEGSDSPSRLALAARKMGYQGIIICNHSGFERMFRPRSAEMVRNIDVVFGLEVIAGNAKALHSRVASARTRFPFIAVHGGTEEINRAACENPDVDVLVHPESGSGDGNRNRKGNGNCVRALSIAAVKAAEKNRVAIGFDLSPMIRLRGGQRSRWLEVVHRNMVLVRKFDLPVVITSGAGSHLDLRSPRDLAALAEVAGFEAEEVKTALEYPARVLELNKKSYPAPGVELL